MIASQIQGVNANDRSQLVDDNKSQRSKITNPQLNPELQKSYAIENN